MSEYIGSRVAIPGTRGYGILKYYGPIEGKQGTFAGIELTGSIISSRGKNNGSVNGIQYFDVIQPMSGLFLPIDRLKQANPHIGNPNYRNSMSNSSLSTNSFNSNSKNRLSGDSLPDSPQNNDVIYTPSPSSNRTSLQRVGSSRVSSSLGMNNGGGAYSPPNFINNSSNNISQSINIPKQRDIIKSGTIGSNKTTPINSPPLHNQQIHSTLPQHVSMNNQIYSNHSNSNSFSRNSSLTLNNDSTKLQIQKDYNELKLKYELNEREIFDKMEILNELRNTVNDLQPLLEEYELDLIEKDRKILKQKNEFERVREDWRQSLDLMVNTQQETEMIYQQKLNDLHEVIERLSKEKDELLSNQSNTNTYTDTKNDSVNISQSKETETNFKSIEEIKKLNSIINDLNLEKSIMEKNLTSKLQSQDIEIIDLKKKLVQLQEEIDELSKEANSSYNQFTNAVTANHTDDEGEDVNEKIEQLEHSISMLQQDKSSFEFTIEQLNAKIKHQNNTITELEIELDESNNKENINELSDKVNSVKLNEERKTKDIDDDNDNDKQSNTNNEHYERIINDLKDQLDIRPTFEELSDLQKAIDEIDTLHKDELNVKTNEINSLNDLNKDLQDELSNAKQDIIKLNEKVNTLSMDQQKKLDKQEINQQNESDKNVFNNNDGDLPIYKPSIPIDPSSGKDDWCGLCERDGHSSINCPYENDIF